MSKDLLIVGSEQEAVALMKQLADDGMMQSLENSNERFFVRWPTGPLMGRRFANCLISRELYTRFTAEEPADAQQENDQRWWQEQVLTKFYDALIVL